jgi:GDP-L-fucose synthase
MDRGSKIYVAGHNGLVGSAIIRKLHISGYKNIIKRLRRDLDLTRQADTEAFFQTEKPEYVFVAAARVGGIWANMNFQAEFLSENLQIQNNIIGCSFRYGVKKLLFLGSSCIYPKDARQPITEDSLLSGLPEPTNEGYAIAKTAGLKLCEYYKRQYGSNFIGLIPCNLYGSGDSFDLEYSHFLPALIRKFHEAKINGAEYATVWGSGSVYRELLYADDAAEACVFAMNHYDGSAPLNVGYGVDYTIAEIAETVKAVIGFEGGIEYDRSKPDGMYRKLLDSSKIRALGWKPTVTLREGVALTYDEYCRTGRRPG